MPNDPTTRNELADGAPHDDPFVGLLDDLAQPKPALAALPKLKKKFLE